MDIVQPRLEIFSRIPETSREANAERCKRLSTRGEEGKGKGEEQRKLPQWVILSEDIVFLVQTQGAQTLICRILSAVFTVKQKTIRPMLKIFLSYSSSYFKKILNLPMAENLNSQNRIERISNLIEFLVLVFDIRWSVFLTGSELPYSLFLANEQAIEDNFSSLKILRSAEVKIRQFFAQH